MTDTKRVGPVKFVRDRETKNKVLFREQDTQHIGGLYLRKSTVQALGNPRGVVLTILPATITGAELKASEASQ
jgi:hypothetical protein